MVTDQIGRCLETGHVPGDMKLRWTEKCRQGVRGDECARQVALGFFGSTTVVCAMQHESRTLWFCAELPHFWYSGGSGHEQNHSAQHNGVYQGQSM